MHRVILPLLLVLAISSRPARACEACGCSAQSESGPLLGTGAETLEKGATYVGMRFDWTESRSLSDAEVQRRALRLGDAHSIDRGLATFVTVAHGVAPHVMLSARLSWVDRINIRGSEDDAGTATDVEKHGNSSGLGDTLISLQWQFADRAKHGVAASVLAAVEAPTGATHRHARDGELFEPDHQPGSGSWDPWLGLQLSKTWDRDSLDASALWQGSGKGSFGSDLGDGLRLDVAWVRSLRPKQVCVLNATDIVLDLGWESHAQPLIDGEKESHGGSATWLGPGVRFHFGNWSAFTTVGIPLAQDPRAGDQDASWRFVTGFGVALPGSARNRH